MWTFLVLFLRKLFCPAVGKKKETYEINIGICFYIVSNICFISVLCGNQVGQCILQIYHKSFLNTGLLSFIVLTEPHVKVTSATKR